MTRRVLYTVVALAAGLIFCTHAGATTITTTSFSTWESSAYIIGSATELQFNTVQLTTYDTATGIMLYGIQHPSVSFDFTGPDSGSYNLTGATYHSITALAGPSDGVGYINVAAPSGGENAILLSIGSTGNTPLTLWLSDGESFPVANGLFGLSISHSITWLALSTTSGSQPVIDDFYYGSSSLPQDSPTAEAATFVLFGGGLLILFGARRRLRKLVT